MNPFLEKTKTNKINYYSLKDLALKPYDKFATQPYSKTRIILMNGTEFESVGFYHQFARHCTNNDIRREISEIRRQEQQQQKRLSSLKPINETILETTLSYEQLAVDLTAIMAQKESDITVKNQLDFALLEDFDHLYRFTDLLEMDEKQSYKNLIGHYTEIMPGRPTIAEHRHPFDDIRKPLNFTLADPLTKLNVSIITAAEQQTMNYYMNVGAFYHSDYGRKMYSEIAMIEEQHVSGYESLKDPTTTWLECALMHEYTECYLYYSCYKDESDAYLKAVWLKHFEDELTHLNKIANLLEKYEGKHYLEVILTPDFPSLLSFRSNKSYIREVLTRIRLTSQKEDYILLDKLPTKNTFSEYQNKVVRSENGVPSHKVIEKYIAKNGKDLRFEESPHPEKALRDRETDNYKIGRIKGE
ncbi:MAG: hypothetical protein J6R29_05095 [Clostridia bacterium]|nr:hypothetical protein [Clostridia bacterium]